MKPQINIIPSHQLDKTKWDNCIRTSGHALIYTQSLYLDHIAANWHGIVVNDYDAVMPVAWRKKLGIKYCYAVPFVQQLGWFSKTETLDATLMIDALFRFCRYGDYAFNYRNNIDQKNATQHINYILDLSKSYSAIAAGYTTDFANNINKAKREDFIYADETIENAISVYRDLYKARTPHVLENDYNNFQMLAKHLAKNNSAFAKKICDQKNETLAVALFLKDEGRIYNLMNSTTEAGRKLSANHFLFDTVFKEFAESPLLFDFEGSDIPGIKSFYEKTGAVNQPYSAIHFNHLPFPLRLLKR